MKKTYKTPKYKTIDLAGEELIADSYGQDIPEEVGDVHNVQGNGIQLVKGHSAWDDEW